MASLKLKSKSTSQMWQQAETLSCAQKHHKQDAIKFVCTSPNCNHSRLCCSYCLVQAHLQHPHIPIKNLDLDFTSEARLFQQLLYDTTKDFELAQESRLHRLVKDMFVRIQQSCRERLAMLRDSLTQQLRQFRKKILKADQQFTRYYQTLAERLNQCGIGQSQELKASVLAQLKYENSINFFIKSDQLQRRTVGLADWLVNELQKCTTVVEMGITGHIDKAMEWNAYSLPFWLKESVQIKEDKRFKTPPKRVVRLGQSGSALVTNKMLIQQSLRRKSRGSGMSFSSKRSSNF